MKTCHYYDCMPIVLGKPARLYPQDHPLASNTRWVRTSPVQSIVTETARGPVFITRNTRWEPAAEWQPTYPANVQHRYA